MEILLVDVLDGRGHIGIAVSTSSDAHRLKQFFEDAKTALVLDNDTRTKNATGPCAFEAWMRKHPAIDV